MANWLYGETDFSTIQPQYFMELARRIEKDTGQRVQVVLGAMDFDQTARSDIFNLRVIFTSIPAGYEPLFVINPETNRRQIIGLQESGDNFIIALECAYPELLDIDALTKRVIEAYDNRGSS